MLKKSQTLLVAVFLLALASIFMISLTNLWKTEGRMRADSGNSLIAFYIAQAGVERAKIELINWDWPGITDEAFGAGRYTVIVSNIDAGTRDITASGYVQDTLRVINVRIKRTLPPPPYIYSQVPGSWKEI